MPIGRARDSDLRQGLRKLFLEPFIQSPQQHVGSGGSISVHGNDGVAARDEIEGTRLVEPMAGKVQAVEIVAGGAQPLEKVQRMIVAGDEPGNLRSAPFDAPAMRKP